jgi:hypothetical protein
MQKVVSYLCVLRTRLAERSAPPPLTQSCAKWHANIQKSGLSA